MFNHEFLLYILQTTRKTRSGRCARKKFSKPIIRVSSQILVDLHIYCTRVYSRLCEPTRLSTSLRSDNNSRAGSTHSTLFFWCIIHYYLCLELSKTLYFFSEVLGESSGAPVLPLEVEQELRPTKTITE